MEYERRLKQCWATARQIQYNFNAGRRLKQQRYRSASLTLYTRSPNQTLHRLLRFRTPKHQEHQEINAEEPGAISFMACCASNEVLVDRLNPSGVDEDSGPLSSTSGRQEVSCQRRSTRGLIQTCLTLPRIRVHFPPLPARCQDCHAFWGVLVDHLYSSDRRDTWSTFLYP